MDQNIFKPFLSYRVTAFLHSNTSLVAKLRTNSTNIALLLSNTSLVAKLRKNSTNIALRFSNTLLVAKLSKNSTNTALRFSNTSLVAKLRKNTTKITYCLYTRYTVNGYASIHVLFHDRDMHMFLRSSWQLFYHSDTLFFSMKHKQQKSEATKGALQANQSLKRIVY